MNPAIKAFLIVDEAHYIKQVNGEWANSVLSLAPFAKFRAILTGTPLPKSFSDVFNMFDFLYPDNPPLDENLKSQILICEKQKDMIGAKRILEDNIRPFIL